MSADVPPPPHAFYGTVTINGSPAPVGTRVEAMGDNVITGTQYNPIYTTVSGRYGFAEATRPKLIVTGFILDGTVISFYVNGVLSSQTAEWHSGEATEINLSITSSNPTTQPPVAAFISSKTTGYVPLEVKFTDKSTGNPTSWAWDFDNDGTVDSTIRNPSCTYTSAGTYSVKLTVTNSAGSDDELKINLIKATMVGVTIIKYALNGTTILDQATVSYQWMMNPANIPVLGDGMTHYYHQGPVFVDDPDKDTEQLLRWNKQENINVQEKDMGALKGTNIKNLCDLVGGMEEGDKLKIKAKDGFYKIFPYKNVYRYSSREGPMVLTWQKDGLYPDNGYDDGMRLVWFADTSTNPWGIHAFGNWDWHEAADPEYWYYYDGEYPTTTGLSVYNVTELLIYSNMSAETPVLATPSSGAAGIFGDNTPLPINSAGVVQETIKISSPNGELAVTIQEGTVLTDKNGNPVTSLTAALVTDPPEGNITVPAYDFGPDGTNFNPPITFTYRIPEGVDAEKSALAYYDETAGKWIALTGTVENGVLTVQVAHFSIFALIALSETADFTVSQLMVSPREVEPGDKVSLQVQVNNNGLKEGSYNAVLMINGVKQQEKTVVVRANKSEIVTFSVTAGQPGEYKVSIGSLTDKYTVVMPASFILSELTVVPAESRPGEKVMISVTVSNTGGKEGIYTAVLMVNDVREEEKSLSLAAGNSGKVTFELVKETAGNYTVTIGDLKGQFTVIALPVASTASPVSPSPSNQGVELSGSQFNWALTGGLIGGVLVIAGVIVFLVRRKRSSR